MTHTLSLAALECVCVRSHECVCVCVSAACSSQELECNNHQCVHRSLWCDGRRHCSDSSDEWNCGKTLCPFLCWSMSAVIILLLCKIHILLNVSSRVREALMLCLPPVSLSDEGLVLVYKAGLEYQVCADGWSSNLSSITCTQMGLG